MSRLGGWLVRLILLGSIAALVGWPVIATLLEAARPARSENDQAHGDVMDLAGTAAIQRETGGLARPARLAFETLALLLTTELLVLPIGLALALLLFRTDVWGARFLLALLALSAFVPLPLHATAWLGALGNAGRMQAIGVRPVLVGRFGAAVIHALAGLPWVVFLAGIGFRTVEPELEELTLLDHPAWSSLPLLTLRRGLGAIAAAALAVAVLTAGDMTVTDLLQVRTYAEEAYIQFTLGRAPADAAWVALPPMLLLGGAVLMLALALLRVDPARLASSHARARVWKLGGWRVSIGVVLLVFAGNLVALPLYSLVWRAGRVGGRAMIGRPPEWSLGGLWGTLRFAFNESLEPLGESFTLAAVAASLVTILAWALVWFARRSRAWGAVALLVLVLTIATPGPVAGMALQLAYRGLPSVYDSQFIVVMAMAMRTFPYALLVLWPALKSMPTRLFEAAAVDGQGPWGQVVRVALPLSAPAILAAWCVCLVLGMGELPATNIVLPPGVTTITFLIWTMLHTGVESHLAGVALVMLGAVAVTALPAIWGLWFLVTGGARKNAFFA